VDVQPLRVFWIAAVLSVIALTAHAAPHTRATLIVSADTAKPGDTVLAGVRLQMDPQWHTYWQNPGASGLATKIAWQLPPGITAGPMQWPVPEKLPDEDLTTYIYTNEVVLLVPLKLAADLPAGPLELSGKVSWLECEIQCVPGSATVHSPLVIGPETKPSTNASLLAAWQQKVPADGAALQPLASWEKAANGNSRPLLIEWHSPAASDADFFPDASEKYEIQGPTERLPAETGLVLLRKIVKKFEGEWPDKISGVAVEQTAAGRQAHAISAPVTAYSLAGSSGASITNAASSSPAATGSAVALPTPSLGLMLLYAFLGGLILNVMPCVLPVIALKILGFVGQAHDSPGEVRKLGIVYAVGVVVSFLLLAGLIIGVKAAGHQAGWGMQFGNPQFLVCLTVLVMLVSLNLFGVFEINLGGNVMGAAGNLAANHGVAGAFFNGVLATILATPCTAPFLGYALGFAFSQPAAIIVLIFVTVALGLAAPYVVLSWQPAWLKFLPKPGAWMERFKVAMGFPMLATAVWLFSLIPLHYGKRTLWLGIFLVVVALAAWVYGEFVQRGRSRKGLGLAVALVLFFGGYLYAVEGQLRWRSPDQAAEQNGSLRESADGIDWQRWTPAAVAEARAAGHPVFVDFTADWCLTCQANKRVSIEIPSVRQKLKSAGFVSLLGDYTRLPDNITTELNRYGRAGVPLVLVYPKNPTAPPVVLPEALTPGIVLSALDSAAGS
jgi:thiol:disulfide interchange protein DsbD